MGVFAKNLISMDILIIPWKNARLSVILFLFCIAGTSASENKNAMDPNTNKIYLAIGATASILAGALGYYILVLNKSKNKEQIKPPASPPVVETPNLEEKKKAAAAFISKKLNSNEEFQTFSSKNVGLAVTKDIQDNNGIVDDKSSEAVDNNEEGQENSDME